MLYIGVDLGTSAVKLLMMDENGNIQKIVSKEYPLYFPYPGWSEQNPQDWFAQSMEGIKELTSECDKSQVAGISFGGQMHGLVVLDKEDQVIRPAILWNDGRTTKETNYLNQVIGKDKLSEYTANIAFAKRLSNFLSNNLRPTSSGFFLCHYNLSVNSFLQFSYMRNNSNKFIAFRQSSQGFYCLLQ